MLNGVSSAIPRGALTALIGPNGAGKTTLFHAITGDLVPQRGRIRFNDRQIQGLAPWKIARLGLGKLFQDVRVFGSLTSEENVMLALHEHPMQSALGSFLSAPFRTRLDQPLREEAHHWLRTAGVEPPYDVTASSLSFGNQKLLALARLLAGKFDLLLLDEPTAGVSPQLTAKIAELLKRLVRAQGTTVLLIEHNLSFVADVADQVMVMSDGAIIDAGPTANMLANPAVLELCIGLTEPSRELEDQGVP